MLLVLVPCFSAVFFDLARNAELPTTQSAHTVQQVLGVPTSGDGVLRAIKYVKQTLAERKPSVPATDVQYWSGVAELILAGQTPDELTQIFAQGTPITPMKFSAQLESHYGDVTFRVLMLKKLRAAAAEAEKVDRKAGTRLARACVVFAVNDRVGSCGLSPNLVRNGDTFNVVGLLELEHDDGERVAQAVSVFAVSSATRAARGAAAEALERMIAGPATEPFDSADVDVFFENIPIVWKGLQMQTLSLWQTANMIWRFDCLARSRHENAVLKRLEDVVASLKPQTPDLFARRWLDEAITMPGPVPKSAGYRVVRSPNDLKPRN